MPNSPRRLLDELNDLASFRHLLQLGQLCNEQKPYHRELQYKPKPFRIVIRPLLGHEQILEYRIHQIIFQKPAVLRQKERKIKLFILFLTRCTSL